MTLLATDTFTGTDGTLITSRNCDTGQSWTRAAESDAGALGDITIRSNTAAEWNAAVTNGARATLDVSAVGTPTSIQGVLLRSAAGDSFPTLWLRAQSAAKTGYSFQYHAVADGQWYLSRWSAGSETALGATAGVSLLADGQSATVTLAEADHGNGTLDLVLTVVTPSETTNLTLNDPSTPLAAGNPGISFFNVIDTSLIKSWTSIQVDGTVLATALPTLFHRSQTFSRRRR